MRPRRQAQAAALAASARVGKDPRVRLCEHGPRRDVRRLVLRSVSDGDLPAGAGKTEAVLLDWLFRRLFHPDEAERRRTPRRLVLALPMRVLVEQTLKRARCALDRLERAGRLPRSVRVYPLMGGMADDSWALEPE